MHPSLPTLSRPGAWPHQFRQIFLACLTAAICLLATSGAQAADAETVRANVDGREARIDQASVETRVQGDLVELDAFKAYLRERGVSSEAEYVRLIVEGSRPQTLDGVDAQLRESRTGELGVELRNFSTHLARGPRLICVGIPGFWEICFWIEWDSARNPQVTVDGRLVALLETTAQIGDDPTPFSRVLGLLGDEPIEVKHESIRIGIVDGRQVRDIITDDVSLAIQGNQFEIQGLGPTLAREPHPLQICITLGEYVICVTIDIDWAEDVIKAHPVVTVDGQRMRAEPPTVEIDGRPADYLRVLEIFGNDPMTPSFLAVSNQDDEPLTLRGEVQAQVQNNHFAFTGLSQALASYGWLVMCLEFEELGIRICFPIGWDREFTPDVTLDAREVLTEEPRVELDGRAIDFQRAVTIVGRDAISTSDLQIRTPAGEVIDAPRASVEMRGEQIDVRGLSNLISIHGELEVCFIIAGMEFCIPIKIGKEKEPQIFLNGREVMAYNPRGLLDNNAVDPLQVLALLNDDLVSTFTVMIAGAAVASSQDDGLTASVEGNHIHINGFNRSLWPSGRDKVEICIGMDDVPLWGGSIWLCVDITDWIYGILDDRGQIELPAHRVHGQIAIQYEKYDELRHPIPENMVALEAFSVTAQDEFGNPVLHLDQPYSMTVRLRDQIVESYGDRIDPETVKLVVWGEADALWYPLRQATYTPDVWPLVMGTLDHFSDFAVLAEVRDAPVEDPQDDPQDDPEWDPEDAEPDGEEQSDEADESQDETEEEPGSEDNTPEDAADLPQIFLPMTQR